MTKFRLEFTEQQMQVLNAALMEMPFKLAAPLVQSINVQIAAAAEPAATEDTAAEEDRE